MADDQTIEGAVRCEESSKKVAELRVRDNIGAASEPEMGQMGSAERRVWVWKGICRFVDAY